MVAYDYCYYFAVNKEQFRAGGEFQSKGVKFKAERQKEKVILPFCQKLGIRGKLHLAADSKNGYFPLYCCRMYWCMECVWSLESEKSSWNLP